MGTVLRLYVAEVPIYTLLPEGKLKIFMLKQRRTQCKQKNLVTNATEEVYFKAGTRENIIRKILT